MVRKTVIISPYPKDDLYEVNLFSDENHIDVSYNYAMSKRIKDVTFGYVDLAALNYVVLFVLDNIIEVYAGGSVNDKQISELRSFIDDYQSYVNDLPFEVEFGMISVDKKLLFMEKYDDVDDLLKQNYGVSNGKDDTNVRKKVRS